MSGDIETGIELPTQRWQCSGCDRLCGALLPGSVGIPPWSCTEKMPDWRKVDSETVHEINVQQLSTGRMVQELIRRGAIWKEFDEASDTMTVNGMDGTPTEYQGPMTVLIIKRPYEPPSGVPESIREMMRPVPSQGDLPHIYGWSRPLPESKAIPSRSREVWLSLGLVRWDCPNCGASRSEMHRRGNDARFTCSCGWESDTMGVR